MDCSTPGFPILYNLPEFAQTHVHWVDDVIPSISSSVAPVSSSLNFPVSGSFPLNLLFASGGQSIGASTSASVLPTNIQGWFPLKLREHRHFEHRHFEQDDCIQSPLVVQDIPIQFFLICNKIYFPNYLSKSSYGMRSNCGSTEQDNPADKLY